MRDDPFEVKFFVPDACEFTRGRSPTWKKSCVRLMPRGDTALPTNASSPPMKAIKMPSRTTFFIWPRWPLTELRRRHAPAAAEGWLKTWPELAAWPERPEKSDAEVPE